MPTMTRPNIPAALRAGAETWSQDGRAHGPKFPGLTEAERAAGQTYATHLPSMFVVGHVDYVRTVSLRPLGPEQTELTAEWLFSPDALASDGFDLDNIVSFGVQVLEEDAGVCEINQRGLQSARHEAGVLMPEEYDIHRFTSGCGRSMKSLSIVIPKATELFLGFCGRSR